MALALVFQIADSIFDDGKKRFVDKWKDVKVDYLLENYLRWKEEDRIFKEKYPDKKPEWKADAPLDFNTYLDNMMEHGQLRVAFAHKTLE